MEYDDFDYVENRRETPAEMRLVKAGWYFGLTVAFIFAAGFGMSHYRGKENILKSDLQKTKIERGYELQKGDKSLEMKVLEKRD